MDISWFDNIKALIEERQLFSVSTVLNGADIGRKMLVYSSDQAAEGDLGDNQLNEFVINEAQQAMRQQKSRRVSFEQDDNDSIDIFIDVYAPPMRLIVIGAVHIAIPLVKFAKILGFYTIIVDARSAFATRERFPDVDELIKKWPSSALEELAIDEGTAIVTLTHDDKLDNPALEVALKSKAFYIGALGSKKTHAKRVVVLKEAGLTEAQISKIHAPIGLDLGVRDAAGIALSTISEIMTVKSGLS